MKATRFETDRWLCFWITGPVFLVLSFIPYMRIKGEWVSLIGRSLEPRSGFGVVLHDLIIFMAASLAIGWLIQYLVVARRNRRRGKGE